MEDSLYQDIIYDDVDLALGLFPANTKECFVNIPTGTVYPMSYERIQLAQEQCGQSYKYERKQVNPNVKLYFTDKNKIYVPQDLARLIIQWYHNALNHPGIERTKKTYDVHFFTPYITEIIKEVCSKCELCQKNKLSNINYGLIPPRNVSMQPWQTVAVDLVGPWKMNVKEKTLEFHALTIIDQDTNLAEIVRIENKTSSHIATLFENTWLARYPKPERCIHDKGREFTGEEFYKMLHRFNIKPIQITTKNPQGNSVCERMHQSMANQMRTMRIENPPQDDREARMMVDTLLANVMYALRTGVHSVLNEAPGTIAFHRDMILNLPFIVDLNNMRMRRQRMVDKYNVRENMKRIDYNYEIGDLILIRKDTYKILSKMDERFIGPYPILKVHVNGTVTIRRRRNVTERINIRRIKPFNDSTPSDEP